MSSAHLTGTSRTPVVIDALSLALITLASSLPFIGQLGFYSDDWGLLAAFDAADRQGALPSLVASGFVARPVQGVYLALLFKLFRFGPLGYHVANIVVLAACASLLYLILIRLRLGRTQSFATTVLFVFLPQLSTVRVWYAAFQIPLSLAFALISLHCQLSFARSGSFGWLAGAIIAAILAIGAYEIYIPLIGGFAFALAFTQWRSLPAERQSHSARTVIASVAITTVVVLGLAYKLLFSGRTGAVGDPERYLLGLYQLVRPDYDWRIDSGLNILAALHAHFWAPVDGWWTGAESLLAGRSGPLVSVIAFAVAGVTAWRLAERSESAWQRPSVLLLLGVAAFVLGHMVFLVVPSITFNSTGMGNRVHAAGAMGVAMIFASLFTFAARAIPQRHRTVAFASALALVTSAAFARMATIERFWAEAPALQQRVLEAARADLSHLPAHSTVILDGVCPYYGPAVVFETNWDIGPALSLALGRPVNGDVVSPRMTVTRWGIQTSIYKEPSVYGFATNLYVYNPVDHLLVRLDNRDSAVRYFATQTATKCPVGFVGRGVEV